MPDITAQLVEGHNTASAEQPSGVVNAGASQHKLPKLKWKKIAVNELQKVSCQRLSLPCPPPLDPPKGPMSAAWWNARPLCRAQDCERRQLAPQCVQAKALSAAAVLHVCSSACLLV